MQILKSIVRTLAVYIGMMSGLGLGFGILALLRYVMGTALEERFFFLVVYLSTWVWIFIVGYILGRVVPRGHWKELLFASALFVISIQWAMFEIAGNEWSLFEWPERGIFSILMGITLAFLWIMASVIVFLGVGIARIQSLYPLPRNTNP